MRSRTHSTADTEVRDKKWLKFNLASMNIQLGDAWHHPVMTATPGCLAIYYAGHSLGTWQLVFQLWVKVLPLCQVKDTQNKGCVRWQLFRSHCGYSGSKRKSLFSNKVTYKRLFIDPLWMSLSSHTAPKIYLKNKTKPQPHLSHTHIPSQKPHSSNQKTEKTKTTIQTQYPH